MVHHLTNATGATIWLMFALASVGCTGADTVPLDLDGTVPLVEAPSTTGDINAAARAEGRRLAEQQCLDNPELSEGVVQIAEPDSSVVVAEIIVDCSEVR